MFCVLHLREPGPVVVCADSLYTCPQTVPFSCRSQHVSDNAGSFCADKQVPTDPNCLFFSQETNGMFLPPFIVLSPSTSGGRTFLTLPLSSLFLKQLLLISQDQSLGARPEEGENDGRVSGRGLGSINDTNSFHSFSPSPLLPRFFLLFLSPPSTLTVRRSTPLHLQSDLCYSSP